MFKRRDVLTTISAFGVTGLAGCAGGNDDAGEDSTDAETETEAEAETEAETESYDPNDYYGLPKCDGSKPIQLIDVQGSEGIIRNMTTDDLLVAVDHDDDGFSDGDYCGAHIVEGGEQTAYETFGSSPRRVYIRAIEDTSRHRDEICSQTGMTAGDGGDGCVDPDAFSDYSSVSPEEPVETEPDDDGLSDVTEAAIEEANTTSREQEGSSDTEE